MKRFRFTVGVLSVSLLAASAAFASDSVRGPAAPMSATGTTAPGGGNCFGAGTIDECVELFRRSSLNNHAGNGAIVTDAQHGWSGQEAAMQLLFHNSGCRNQWCQGNYGVPKIGYVKNPSATKTLRYKASVVVKVAADDYTAWRFWLDDTPQPLAGELNGCSGCWSYYRDNSRYAHTVDIPPGGSIRVGMEGYLGGGSGHQDSVYITNFRHQFTFLE